MIKIIPIIPAINNTTDTISAIWKVPILKALSTLICSIKNLITEYIVKYVKMVILYISFQILKLRLAK